MAAFNFRIPAGLVLLGLCSACPAGSGEGKGALDPVPSGPAPPRWEFRLSAGGAYRSLGDIGFRSGMYSRSGILPSLDFPSHAGGPDAGGPGTMANRHYLDGFVFMDDGTANPRSFLPGTTAYWGYQSDSQVRGGSLYYSAGEFSRQHAASATQIHPRSWSDEIGGGAPVIQLDARYPLTPGLRAGALLSFMTLSSDAEQSGGSFRAERSAIQNRYSVTDRFSLQGVIPPAAPYAGTYSHPGTAPLIDNIPSERIISPAGNSRRSAEFFNTVTESLKLDLHTFSLGPGLEYETGALTLAGNLGLTVNIADWEAGFQETLWERRGDSRRVFKRWRARESGTDVRTGFFVQGAVGARFSERVTLSVFGRYDWTESLKASVGPSAFSADLTGGTLGGMVTFRF